MSNDLTINDLSSNATIKEVLLFIDGSIRRTTEQVLETGYGFHILKEACVREKEHFGNVVEERYSISAKASSRWVKIGSQYDLLMKHRSVLPSSYSTIYSLITLPKKAFNELMESGQINPSITFETAEHYKAIYKADAKSKQDAKKETKDDEDVNPFEEQESEVIPAESDLESGSTLSQDVKEVVEGEFEVVKESKLVKKKYTLSEALDMLEINLDDQFLLAKRTGTYTDDELIKALIVLRGE